MDKVLKRVGLAKWDSDLKPSQTASPDYDNTIIISKRRRCESRRFLHDKKIRGLFNIDWDSVRDCKSCKSRVMTRKLCGKRSDNELYRSNSFKFERFVKCNDETSSIGQTVSLCDDYSLPIDYVKKKRPKSVGVNSSEWNITSPSDEQIKVLVESQPELNERSQIVADVERELFNNPNRKFFQTFAAEYSSDSSSEEFFIRCEKSNSTEVLTESALPFQQPNTSITLPPPKHSDTKRYPSPYYYADLYKPKVQNDPIATKPLKQPNIENLENECRSSGKEENSSFENEKTHSDRKYKKSLSVESNSNDNLKQNPLNITKKCCNLDSQSTDSSNNKNQINYNTDSDHGRNLNDFTNESSSPTALTNIFSQIALNEDEMTRKRHLYETAFDCSVTQQEGEIDIDKVSNHPVLVQLTNNKGSHASASSSTDCDTQNFKASLGQDETGHIKSLDTISQNLRDMHLDSKEESSKLSGTLLLRVFTPSPPSSTLVSNKFYSKSNSNVASSTGSVSNVSSNVRAHHHRTKDLRLPVKSLHLRRKYNVAPENEETTETDPKDERVKEQKNVLEIKDRTRKIFKRHKDASKDLFRYSKGVHRRHKYSSTESMTTSSSGGSMESIQSSTSEGNRSTSSSESRHSTSLSSHSSDSGNTNYHYPQGYNFLIQANKINILSPISDKSSQEPVSETSDNNRNNNSQKCSPEEVSPPTNTKPKKRLPLNKNVINLGFHGGDPEIQGSDSGISIQSRESKTFLGFALSQNQDLTDLPFDMPKLARNRILQKDACTSGSATSIDFKDLPFDMPKLKRRLRLPQSHIESTMSQASSSQSVVDIDKQVTPFKPTLSLNLKDGAASRQKPSLSLSFSRLGLNLNIKNNPPSNDMIDATLPLERQGWYHGAITRVEAEFVLKFLREGSFLVRNSESTRQDYSLSLKSARGFMHMRIQRSGPDSFILGQFSKPFKSIPEMIHHFSLNRLPVRGAEHMCLLQPVIAQLL